MPFFRRSWWLAIVAAAACGGGGGNGGSGPSNSMQNATTGSLTDTVRAHKDSLKVRVTDQTGAPVSGINVAWASSNGAVSSAAVATNSNGHSMVRFTYGPVAGTQTATATAAGVAGSPVTISLTATAATAVSIAKTAGDNGFARPAGTVTYTVTSRDTDGNAKGGVTIGWAPGNGGGSIDPTQNVTGTDGRASATRTLGAGAGDQTATATAAGLTGSPQVTFTTSAEIPPSTATVNVADNVFNPNSINVAVGGTVTWDWGQGTQAAHNVTFAAGGPATIPNRTSSSDSRPFPTAGTFTYACTNHPGMNGTVIVF